MGQRNKFRRSTKIDLSRPDREETERMISCYQTIRKNEVPLIINDKLTIMVTPDKCNERYRRQYIKARGIK